MALADADDFRNAFETDALSRVSGNGEFLIADCDRAATASASKSGAGPSTPKDAHRDVAFVHTDPEAFAFVGMHPPLVPVTASIVEADAPCGT